MRSPFEKSAFQAFCQFLDGKYPSISEELRVELIAEQGHLAVDDIIKKEASQIIYKHFGRTKRISDREKKKIETLIAVRAQCAKEIWRRSLEKAQQAVEDLVMANKEKDEKIAEIIKKLQLYSESQRKKLYGSGRSAKSDRMPLFSRNGERKSNSGRSLLQRFEVAVEDIEHLTLLCINELQSLKNEKERTLEMIAVDDPTAKLDREVELAIHRLAAQLKNSRSQIRDEEQKLKNLEDQLSLVQKHYDDEIRGRDHTIKVLATNLEKVQDNAYHLDSQLGDVKRQLQIAKVELSHSKVKSRYLEKSRHLGYGIENYIASDRASLKENELPRIETSAERKAASYSPAEKKRSKTMSRAADGVR